MLNKLWEFLNGNKTLIGTLGLLILSQSFASGWNEGLVEILQWFFIAIGGTGTLHKVSKAVNKAKKKK